MKTKQLKPYRERIWEIVAAKESIINARNIVRYWTSKRASICEIDANTASGEEYSIILWKGNTLMYGLYGITEMPLTEEPQTQLQEEFSRDFNSAHLYLGPLVESDGKLIFCVNAYFEYRWMGLREFNRCAEAMSAVMDQCVEWLKLRFPDFIQRRTNINFSATHNLLVENNY